MKVRELMTVLALVVLAFADVQAVANSFGSRVVFQLQQGQFCGQVNNEMQYEIYPETRPTFGGEDCPPDAGFFQRNVAAIGEATERFGHYMTSNPALEIEQRIFGEAAERQIGNDQCMAAILDNMQDNPAVLNQWKIMLFTSWLRARKARAMLARCDRIRAPFGRAEMTRDDPSQTARMYWEVQSRSVIQNEAGEWVPAPVERAGGIYKWQRFAESAEQAEELINFCMNPERYEALEMSQAYFMQTVPLINSTSFQDVLTQNQNMVVNQSTGEPLTDDELLGINLENPQNLLNHIRVNPAMFAGIDTALEQTRQERVNQASELRATLDGTNRDHIVFLNDGAREAFETAPPGSRLTQEQKEYLYHQGMVHEALEARGQLREDFSGNLTDLTAPAVCMMSGYESSFLGEALQFGLTAFVGGGAFTALRGGLAIARGARAAQQATRWQRVGDAVTAGFTEMGVREVANGCFVTHTDEGMPAISQPDTPEMIRVGANLPDDVGPNPFARPNLMQGSGTLPDADFNQVLRAPQCSGKYGFLRQHIERVSCVEAALVNTPGLNMTAGLALEGFFMLQ